jgi:hypothetical protein
VFIDPFLTGDDPGLSKDLRDSLERMKAKLDFKKAGGTRVLSENAEEIDIEDLDIDDLNLADEA